jgi:hypothetical protein
VAGIFLSLWSFAHLVPNRQPPPFWQALVAGSAAGWLAIYFWPWIFSFLPSYVFVFEDRIKRIVGDHNQCWKLADIRWYAWHDCDNYDMLALDHKAGIVVFGIPRKVSRVELTRLFEAKGIPEINGKESQPPSVVFDWMQNEFQKD